MPLFKYTPYTTAGPDGTSLRFRAGDSGAQELAEFDGHAYVHAPDGTAIPDQPAEIAWQAITPDAALLARIKFESRPVQLIAQAMVAKIRASYSIDDEMFFARIGVGAATGMYQPTPDEMQEMTVFGEFVESVRQWGRTERAKLGLA